MYLDIILLYESQSSLVIIYQSVHIFHYSVFSSFQLSCSELSSSDITHEYELDLLTFLYDPTDLYLVILNSHSSYLDYFSVTDISFSKHCLFRGMTCCSFSKPSQLSHCSKHLIINDFLSYQASLVYNPKEFLGVITNWRRCRGEEIEAQLPWDTT
jgi:hypothetical protein